MVTRLTLTPCYVPRILQPKPCILIVKTMNQKPWLFTTDNISFQPSGEATIIFHGIENDTARTGFQVTLQLAQEPINLILFEHFGITLTGLVINQQPQENPVFLAFTPPYGSITAKTVANVMNEAVDAVGLSGQGFSAKSFRPTGATLAVESGCDPEIAMQIGRWKTKSVFYEHYVHSKPPVTFSDNIWFQEYSLVDHQRCHLRSLTCSFILLKMSTPLYT